MSRITQEVRVQTPPAPAAPRTVDPREINQRIEDAVNQALSQIGDKQGDNAKQSIREAIQDIQQEIQAARAEGRSITIQPQFGDNVIPPQVVDISLAFFFTMAFIIVGLPLARAFARRMDRRGEPASASQIAPRLDRIEQAVEAIAIEVERVSEGQRYTTKSIAELRGLPVPNAGSWSAREAERVPAGERRP
jgi:hypothetical protein